jgi:tryptophan synthase alpha chain
MKNRIDEVFKIDKKLLSIYFSAGHPSLNDTSLIIKNLQSSGVDMIEIGLPFSDPLADGPIIQNSSEKALMNGMNTEKLFKQLEGIRDEISVPLIIMGYFNPILQYGIERFCEKCKSIGIDGLIIPDLPVDVYVENYQYLFDKNGLFNMFLITPQTSNERIKYIDKVSKGFIYMVSSASVTGVKNTFNETQTKYFKRIESMNLKTPTIVGFGISNSETFNLAVGHSNGAIIGSAFIKFLEKYGVTKISEFVKSIR